MTILKTFNSHFVEFLGDIVSIFPDDKELMRSKNSLEGLVKINPKMVIKVWNNYIVSKYQQEIESGNIEFFINKNYNLDVKNAGNSDTILSKIETLREPVKNMGVENQKKTMKYIQNLTKLTILYFNE
jgi:hypothetical protein